MTTFAIGVDLGGTNLRIAVVESTGKIVEKITLGTDSRRGSERVIDDMCAAARTLALKYQGSGDFVGIGVGIPGIIDMKTGTLRESPNLPGWRDYPVQNEIERRLGTSVFLENDANAAALGENWLGSGAGVSDMCMLTLGTGVGGGLVFAGRAWHGMTGMAGELGHIVVDAEGPVCNCGGRGCLEQFASATAVKRMVVEAVSSGKAPELARAAAEDPEFSSKMVHQMAMQGDQAARRIFDCMGTALGIAVAGLINIFNFPIYVIGGGVANAWDAFAPAMMEAVRRHSYIYRVTAPPLPASEASTPGTHTIIVPALLGGDAGLIGAARLPLIA